MARHVTARWDGKMSTTVTFNGGELPVGDDAVFSTGDAAPLPTEVLLGSVASCFALAMAFAAAKRDQSLPGLTVDVIGDYDGPRLAVIDIEVAADADPDFIDMLLPRAERLCWVTNTLRADPQISIRRRS